jgi:hypothetical protein
MRAMAASLQFASETTDAGSHKASQSAEGDLQGPRFKSPTGLEGMRAAGELERSAHD